MLDLTRTLIKAAGPRVLAAILAALAAGPAGSRPAGAGAWLQEPGTAYVRMSGGLLTTGERFDAHGNRAPFDMAGAGFRGTEYEDIAGSLYAEVGVHRDWNLVWSANWKHLRAVQPSAVFETYGFGDAYLGVKRSLWRGSRTVASAQALVTLPTGYEPGDYPSLGSDAAELALVLAAGTSTAGAWFTGEGGYAFRGGVFRDRVLGAFGGGTGLGRGIDLRGEARGEAAVGSAKTGAGDLRFDPATVDPSRLELAATVSAGLGGGLAVEAEVRGTVWGENTLAGTRWGLALATRPAWRWRR